VTHLLDRDLLEPHNTQEHVRHFLHIHPITVVRDDEDNGVVLFVS
jgi:hypothetical protein